MTAVPPRPTARVAVVALVVVAAVVVQVTVTSRLPLPGATPDLVLVAVVALALAHGPGVGLGTGFAAGLTLDLAPPADSEVGRWALVLTLVGYLAGLAGAATADRSGANPLVVVAVSGAGSVLAYAGLGAALGDPRVSWSAVTDLLPTAVLYDVVLATFVVPGLRAGTRGRPGRQRREVAA